MRAYEIQTFKDGEWRVDSIFDDRELALFEARKINEGTRYAGVKVVEENYDAASDLTTTRTLFRGGAAKVDRQKKPEAPAKAKRPASRGGKGKDAKRKGSARPKAKSTNMLVPILILLVLLLMGATAFLGLQYLQ